MLIQQWDKFLRQYGSCSASLAAPNPLVKLCTKVWRCRNVGSSNQIAPFVIIVTQPSNYVDSYVDSFMASSSNCKCTTLRGKFKGTASAIICILQYNALVAVL